MNKMKISVDSAVNQGQIRFHIQSDGLERVLLEPNTFIVDVNTKNAEEPTKN